MPEIGDIVIYYTHESWDNNHRVQDAPAIVTGVVPGPEEAPQVLRLKVFAYGAHPFDAEVSEFPDDIPRDAAGNPVYGAAYWREAGSDAPDFGARYEATAQADAESAESDYDREIRLLEERQALERANTDKPDSLKARHELERKQIDERYDSDDNPRVDLQSGNAPQPGQPTRPLVGPDEPPPQVPPKIGSSLPKIL
jgi:hypothetical protein